MKLIDKNGYLAWVNTAPISEIEITDCAITLWYMDGTRRKLALSKVAYSAVKGCWLQSGGMKNLEGLILIEKKDGSYCLPKDKSNPLKEVEE